MQDRTLLRMVLALIVALLIGAAGYAVWSYNYIKSLESQLLKNDQAVGDLQSGLSTLQQAATASESQLSALQQSVNASRSDVSTLQQTVVASQKAAAASPANSYTADDPRVYLKPFLDALAKNDAQIIRSFFDDPRLYTAGSPLQVIDLTKDFSVFSFNLSSWTPSGIVTVYATDPEFNQRKINFYTKSENGQWKILGVDDSTSVLK